MANDRSRRFPARKILVATLGVAVANYALVGCAKDTPGNLMSPVTDAQPNLAPPSAAAAADAGSTNVVDAGSLANTVNAGSGLADAGGDARPRFFQGTSGNLMPPPPIDGGKRRLGPTSN